MLLTVPFMFRLYKSLAQVHVHLLSLYQVKCKSQDPVEHLCYTHAAYLGARECAYDHETSLSLYMASIIS